MTEITRNLALPLIMPAQAQKHVTHNEALRALDAVVQTSFVSIGENEPPTNPDEGSLYAIGAAPTDAWLGKAQKIGAWQDGAWAFLTPKTGWIAWDKQGDRLIVFDGSEWIDATLQPGELQNIAVVGISAAADSENRLAVASAATLLTHQGQGHQLKINKNEAHDTGSVLFQTGWSGRAEFGLTGDDDWHVKVTADGSSWREALIADRNDGSVKFPNGMRHAQSGALLRSQIFTPGGSGVSTIWRFDEPRTGFPRQATLDSVSGDLLTLADASLYGDNAGQTGPVANKTFFRNDTMEGLSFLRLWNISKSPAEACWIRASSGGSGLLVTDSTHISGWQAGDIVQLGEPSLAGSRIVAVDISQFLALHTGAVFPQAGLALLAGISAQGSGGWNGHIGVTPDGSGGSFANVTSASSDHASSFDASITAGGGFINGMIQVGSIVSSPISNSNLLFVREQDAGAGTLRLGALTAVGVWV